MNVTKPYFKFLTIELTISNRKIKQLTESIKEITALLVELLKYAKTLPADTTKKFYFLLIF